MNDIDFVIPWVDGSDKAWQKSFNQYAPKSAQIDDARAERYRDWGLLKYWFRGVEQFTPWVRKVHFITCGQLPEWLNPDAPKLHWVKHEDYMPKEILPVFNSHPIELNLHRINGLSDKFVYFNDDTFITRTLPEERFFKNNLPCDMAVCNLLQPTNEGPMTHIMANNMAIINAHFNKHQAIKNHWRKWFNCTYGAQQFRTLLLYPWPEFSILYEHHQPNAYLKSTFEEIWAQDGDHLMATSMTRFRDISNCNQWLMRDWRMVKGEFEPINVAAGSRSCMFGKDSFEEIIRDIKEQHYQLLCINDNSLTPAQIDQMQPVLIQAFESILPNKSSFEK